MSPHTCSTWWRAAACAGVAALLASCSSGGAPHRAAGTTTTSLGSTTSVAPSTSSTTTVPPGPAGGPVPAGFRPQSVTFVSTSTGWVLGEAPCARPPCTSLVRTRDGGHTWRGIPAPAAALAPAASEGSGVSEVRFADAADGWAFGPDLYSTHDGAATWKAETLPAPATGYAVVSLEAAAGQVFALAVPRPGQAGAAVLLRAAASGGAWQPEPGTTVPGGQRGRVVVHGQAGWLVVTTGQGQTTFLARTGDGWQRRSLPCGSPTDALSAATDVDLAVVCGGGGAAGSQVKDVYLSHDGGATFTPSGQAPMAGDLEGVAAGSATTLVVAAASGASDLHATFDGGHTWTTVYEDTSSGGLPWRDLGFTDPSRAVAIEGTAVPQFSQQPASRLMQSVDGGHTWSRVVF